MKKNIFIMIAIMMAVTIYGEVYFIPESLNETMEFSSVRRGERNVPERISVLLDELSRTDANIKEDFDKIGGLIHKEWFTLSEFEKDKNIMLQYMRNTLDELSNLSDRLHSLELELFNPDALNFDRKYELRVRVNEFMETSYNSLQEGRDGLMNSRNVFGRAKSDYAKLTTMLRDTINTVKNAVPYSPPAPDPEPEPEPDPEPEPEPEPQQPAYDYSAMDVYIRRAKVDTNNVGSDQIINSRSAEGQTVLKKAKEREHELSTIDRLMYKQALKGQDGFSFMILKHKTNEYTVYWWNVLDDISDIF